MLVQEIPNALERFSIKPTRLASRRAGLAREEASQRQPPSPGDHRIAPPDQVRGSSQGRFSAIEIVREKRNFDAAAPHWFMRPIHPDPPCYSLLKRLFSLFRARSWPQSAAKMIFLFRWLPK
jgi:hypothetical protein